MDVLRVGKRYNTVNVVFKCVACEQAFGPRGVNQILFLIQFKTKKKTCLSMIQIRIENWVT